jgi:UDP-N-acetylglucosamine--N-acetylmuramyl-(pentapeptide) pyrophosphoryl-undecaprenol N-acetylglucosamine transferase
MGYKPTVIIATGGTGGHLFPAVSLAKQLIQKNIDVHIVCGIKPHQKNNYKDYFNFCPVHVLETPSLEGTFLQKIKKAFLLISSFTKAWHYINQFKPCVVIGFGSYATVPTVKVAQLLGIPTLIHEQNAIIGKANRFLAKKAQKIAVSFAKTKGLPSACHQKVVYTGNLVRDGISELRETPYPVLERDSTIHLLVFGGSQGAKAMNEILPEALALLPEDMRSRFSITQQAQGNKVESVRAKYDWIQVNANIVPFIEDMDAQLKKAHLVICRSGATTVAELTTVGRPAIYVPYPFATDNHQFLNAEHVEKNGGGWILPAEAFTAEALAAKLETILQLPQLLHETANRARSCGKSFATEHLTVLVEDYLGRDQKNKVGV